MKSDLGKKEDLENNNDETKGNTVSDLRDATLGCCTLGDDYDGEWILLGGTVTTILFNTP